MESELVIDEKNFSKYFREITKSMPTHGDALICFRALAHFCDGNLKKEIIDLLRYEFGCVKKCVGRLIKFGGANREQSVKLCLDICKDLKDGMEVKEVLKKEYPFVFEKFYYANPEYVPKDDKRWQVLKLPSTK
jgi:hypothetical protein